MQKVRRKQVLQSCLERRRRVRVVLAKQSRRCHCPSLHLQGAQEPSGGQRLFPAQCCRLGWARGEPARKCRAMHWSKFLYFKRDCISCCTLHVLFMFYCLLFYPCSLLMTVSLKWEVGAEAELGKLALSSWLSPWVQGTIGIILTA